MARKNSQQGQSGSTLPPDVVNTFLELQKEELQVRKQELDLNRQQEANQKEVAKASISAQLSDRNSHREHIERKTRLQLTGGIIILSVVLLFLGYALHAGKEDVVIKSLEIAAIFFSGFAGGYGFKATRQAKEPKSD